MTYDSKVAEAIQGSIDKWIGIAYEEKSEGKLECPLCLCKYDRGCDDCPMAISGKACLHGPYPEWTRNPCQATAIQMLDYLMHLAEWYELTAERV